MLFIRYTTLLLVLAHSAWSQEDCNVVLAGRVVDVNGQPLPGAAVYIQSEETGLFTDVDGSYRFEGLCEGQQYSIRVQLLGFDDAERIIRLRKDQNYTIELKESTTELSEVIIQHHDEAHTEHATNYDQISERELSEHAGMSLGQALKHVQGVNTIQSGPGIFKPVIHGLHSQRILILNHGLRQEGQQWGAEHAPEIDPFIASNIVVIKDASAIKYGTDALGGVIVVNPPALHVHENVNGTLQTVYQSNSRSGAISGMLEGGVEGLEDWGWRVQGTLKRGGDFATPNYNLTNTGVTETNYSVAAGYHPDNAGFDVFFSHFQTEIGILKGTASETKEDLLAAMTRDIPLYTAPFSYNIEAPRQEVSHNLLKINGHVASRGGEWRWQYGFQNNNRKEFDLRIGGLSNIPAIDLRLNTHSVDAEWETRHSERRSFTIGANGTYQINSNIPGTQRIPFIPNFTNISTGLFAIAKRFVQSWTFDVGARFDHRHYDVRGFDFKNTRYSQIMNFGNVSASIGVIKSMKNGQKVTLNVSSAWRPPHVAELYSVGTHQSAAAIEYGLLLNDSTNEVMNIGDSDFAIEQALKMVAGWKGGTETFNIEVAPYVNHIFNYIYLRSGGFTRNVRGVYPYFRYDQTNALFVGADISLNWKLHRYLNVSPQASLLRARDVKANDYFLYVPPTRYGVVARYERPWSNDLRSFYVESDFRYVSRQTYAPQVISIGEMGEGGELAEIPGGKNFDFMAAPPGYSLWDVSAGVSFKPGRTQFDFRLAAMNVLNATYRDYTNRFRYYADEPGRNIIVSLKCIF